MVSVPEWLLLTAQWVHLMGAVTWVGGSIFFKFVLQPAFRRAGAEPNSVRAIGHEFGNIVRIAIVILVVTGAFMAVVHLTAGGNSRVYIGILALKIALAFYMFLVVWLQRRSASTGTASGSDHLWPRVRRAATSTTTLLILGVVVIGLADVLSAVGGHSDGGHDHSGQTKAETAVDGADGSDDHHKAEETVDEEEVQAPVTPEPTEATKEEEDDGHHGDDNSDDQGDEGDDDGGEDEDDHDDGHGHSH